MRKSLTVTGLVLLFVLAAAAQDVPRIETFLGYSYVHFNSASDVPSFSASGGDGQFVYNFNKWIGVVFDGGAVHDGNISGVNLDSTIANFLAGPRVSFRTHHLHPYVQVLWGGAYATTSTNVLAVLPALNPQLGTSQTAFAMTAGGGLDIRITKHVSFRPVALDYYLTRFQNLRTQNDNNQNSLRYTSGFNFTFGAQ
jgi:opacity protein-like surface antigen